VIVAARVPDLGGQNASWQAASKNPPSSLYNDDIQGDVLSFSEFRQLVFGALNVCSQLRGRYFHS
jgi:hypothetical protein